jgi:hypothetical protein
MGQPNIWRWILVAAVLLLGIYIWSDILPDLPSNTGKLDFRAYWSASFLLARGENFADEELLLQVEKAETGWTRDWTLKTWNPPWALAWFIPLTLVNFERAADLWMVANFLLLFVSVAIFWRIYATKQRTQRLFWLPIVAAALFPSAILVFIYGQVGFLVIGSLVGFLLLYRHSHDLSAGALLSVAMVKPHLVYITIPLIILGTLKERRWKVLLGFGLTLLISLIIVLSFRPTFVEDYLSGTTGEGLLNWENSTLTTYLHLRLGWPWIRFIGILLLPLAVVLWARYGNRITLGELVDLTILVSVITAPFGWSYDFVVLLLPLVRILLWVVEGALGKLESAAIVALMVTMYLLYFRQRLQTRSEMEYLWIPLMIAVLYGWVWYRNRSGGIEIE